MTASRKEEKLIADSRKAESLLLAGIKEGAGVYFF
jgi:hypothetical protein